MNNSSEPSAVCEQLPFTVNVVPVVLTTAAYRATVFTIVFNSITCPLVIAGNFLVFVAVLRKPELQTVYNTSMLFLAFTDLLIGLVGQPAFLVYQGTKLHGGNFNCVSLAVYTFVVFLCTGLSLLTLSLMSVERYVAIFYPFKYSGFMTVRRIVLMIGTVWVLWSVCITLLRFYPGINTSTYIITATALVALCFVLVLTIYIKVLHLLKRVKANRKVPALQESETDCQLEVTVPSTNRNPRAARGSKTIVYVTGALFVCFAPTLYTSAVYQLGLMDCDAFYHVLYPISDTAALFNSCCNPFIYVWRSKSVRESFGIMLGIRKRTVDAKEISSSCHKTQL